MQDLKWTAKRTLIMIASRISGIVLVFLGLGLLMKDTTFWMLLGAVSILIGLFLFAFARNVGKFLHIR